MAGETDEDLFAVFGGDEDDDEDEVVDNEATRISRALVDLANRAAVSAKKDSQPLETSDPGRHESLPFIEQAQVKNSTKPSATPVSSGTPLISLWPEHSPLYMGPITIVASLPAFGGGRACIAQSDLGPGTLVLVEEPLVSWNPSIIEGFEKNDEQERGYPSFPLLPSLSYILQLPNAESISHIMEDFHPTKLAVNESEHDINSGDSVEQIGGMMEHIEAQCADDPLFQACLESCCAFSNRDGSPMTQTDLIRILVALRYNALQSGVFLFSAMLNHSDSPNCVKFQPTNERPYSEVRTTRSVPAGDVLTISYLPNIVSHASRRRYLWEQHRFDIGADMPKWLREMELIGKQLPPSDPHISSSKVATTTTRRIEKAVSDLEQLLQDLSAAISPNPGQAVEQQTKVLEQAALELCASAEHQLQNEKHLLLIPCRRLHIDSCYLVLQFSSLSSNNRTDCLTFLQRIQLLGRLVDSVQKLLPLQEQFLGTDHFDLARTHQDFFQAVEELLAKSPKHLIGLTGVAMSVSAWSKLELQSRNEYNRIRALYPYDADKFIQVTKERQNE